MKPRASCRERPGFGEAALIGGSLAAALLVAVVVGRYPESGIAGVGGAAVALLLTTGACVGWLASRRATPATRRTRELGVRSGLALGALWALEIGFNNIVPPEISTAAARGVVDNAFWAAITLLTVAVGAAAARRSGRALDGLVVGAWIGLASGLVACLAGLFLIVFGLPLLLRDPLAVAEYAARGPASGARDFAAYVARETLAGSLGHLYLIGIAFGAAEGWVGGAIGRIATQATTRGSAIEPGKGA